MLKFISGRLSLIIFTSCLVLPGCSSKGGLFVNPDMDFGVVQTIAVMPLVNLSQDLMAADRVRDTFSIMLLSTGEFYVLPAGEVARSIASAGIPTPYSPSVDDVVKFCKVAKVDAVITGVVKEYGLVRSGQTSANVVSISMQMFEGQTGTVVWATSATRGGITIKDRLLGGSGEPLNVITEEALHEIIRKLLG